MEGAALFQHNEKPVELIWEPQFVERIYDRSMYMQRLRNCLVFLQHERDWITISKQAWLLDIMAWELSKTTTKGWSVQLNPKKRTRMEDKKTPVTQMGGEAKAGSLPTSRPPQQTHLEFGTASWLTSTIESILLLRIENFVLVLLHRYDYSQTMIHCVNLLVSQVIAIST